MKKTICLDFDGVCNTYDGWKGEDFLFDPRPGLMEFILALQENNKRVAVFSTRPAVKLRQWFESNFGDVARALIACDDLFFPESKPPADCYIDDRGVRFDGDFQDLLPHVISFKTFWESSRNGGLGATGQFPDGKVSQDDEGELRFAVGHQDGNVVVDFGKPVKWFALPPATARALAYALQGHANEA